MHTITRLCNVQRDCIPERMLPAARSFAVLPGQARRIERCLRHSAVLHSSVHVFGLIAPRFEHAELNLWGNPPKCYFDVMMYVDYWRTSQHARKSVFTDAFNTAMSIAAIDDHACTRLPRCLSRRAYTACVCLLTRFSQAYFGIQASLTRQTVVFPPARPSASKRLSNVLWSPHALRVY